jgi:hypothetical protein
MKELRRLTGHQASRKLHERMAFAIFRSPMSFFETTPAGRILNRFSRYVLAPHLKLFPCDGPILVSHESKNRHYCRFYGNDQRD